MELESNLVSVFDLKTTKTITLALKEKGENFNVYNFKGFENSTKGICPYCHAYRSSKHDYNYSNFNQ
jgi:5-methylcytosine-specific restriction endonuclease McrBC regulatory subunit McrC